jgi:NAD(P)-dependent dehydrogenase (short-subunit alcohol dehydrogenase family)
MLCVRVCVVVVLRQQHVFIGAALACLHPPPPHTHTWFLPPHARGLRAPHTGASQHALAAETTGEVAEKLLKINTLAPIRLTQAALPLMLKR